jgi:hypothetical protein
MTDLENLLSPFHEIDNVASAAEGVFSIVVCEGRPTMLLDENQQALPFLCLQIPNIQNQGPVALQQIGIALASFSEETVPAVILTDIMNCVQGVLHPIDAVSLLHELQKLTFPGNRELGAESVIGRPQVFATIWECTNNERLHPSYYEAHSKITRPIPICPLCHKPLVRKQLQRR